MMSPTPERTPLRNPLALRYPDKSALGVRLPEDWVVQDDDHGADHPMPVPWRLGPAGGEPRLLIDAMFDALREPDMTVPELEVELRRTMVAYEGHALETAPALNAIRSTAGDGLWFLVTDAHPKPDEFLYMTRGALISGTSMVSFTVLTNEGEDAMWLAALSIVATATLIAAPTADEAPAVVAGSPVIGAFLGMTRADEASLFVQDFPELLHADVVSALLAPFGNDLKRAPARVRVAYYCLQRVAAGGLSFAVGPAAFDEISDWMLQLVTALAQTAAPELAALRARVLTGCSSHRDAFTRGFGGALCGLSAMTFASTVTSA